MSLPSFAGGLIVEVVFALEGLVGVAFRESRLALAAHLSIWADVHAVARDLLLARRPDGLVLAHYTSL
jgi:hypothetical protein